MCRGKNWKWFSSFVITNCQNVFLLSVFFVILNTYLQKQSMISIKIFILLNSKHSVNILSYQRKEGKMQMKPKKEELFFIYFLAICTLDCCNLSMTQCLFSALVKNPNPNLKLLNPFSIFFVSEFAIFQAEYYFYFFYDIFCIFYICICYGLQKFL